MVAIPDKTPPNLAPRTLAAIEAAIDADGGARYRALLQKHLPLIDDAYRQDDDPFRSHLGASLIGRECQRELWYGWRWAGIKRFPARVLRLFNRGHLEEARFNALLEMIDVHIHLNEDGGQDRISAHGGHFGSALDGTLYNVPDCPGEWLLGEYKTHGDKSFKALRKARAVAVAKPEHNAQMQACMALRGIHKCLYMAVNKNDDDLYCEIVEYNPAVAAQYLDRARDIIIAAEAPAKVNEDPSAFKCKFCDWSDVCHYGGKVLKNCRTCKQAVADIPSGTWGCNLHGHELDKAAQKKGCEDHEFMPELAR